MTGSAAGMTLPASYADAGRVDRQSLAARHFPPSARSGLGSAVPTPSEGSLYVYGLKGFAVAGTALLFTEFTVFAQAGGGDGSPLSVGGSVGLAIAVGTAVGTAFGIVFKSVGEYIWKPWLENRGFREAAARAQVELEAVRKQAEDNEKRIGELEQARRQDEAASRSQVNVLNARLAELTLTAHQLAHLVMVRNGRLSPDPVMPPTLPIGDVPLQPDGPTVLIVEDQAAARRPLEVMLAHHNFRVGAAPDLSTALAAIEASPPDAVILDLMLPDGDGAEVLREVRRRGLKTRVIVMTGKNPGTIGDVTAMRPDAVLIKPISFDAELLPALKGE